MELISPEDQHVGEDRSKFTLFKNKFNVNCNPKLNLKILITEQCHGYTTL